MQNRRLSFPNKTVKRNPVRDYKELNVHRKEQIGSNGKNNQICLKQELKWQFLVTLVALI